MSEQPTKASQIMALAAQGLSTRAIALEVYGEATPSRMAYVRIVARQRKGSGEGPADVRYRQSKGGRKKLSQRVMRHYWANREDVLARRKELREARLHKELRIS